VKRRFAYLFVLLSLMAVGASGDPPSGSNSSGNADANTIPGVYTLPSDLASWMQQPDSTSVTVGDLQKVASAARDFYNQTFAIQGGAVQEIDNLVNGFEDASPDPNADNLATLDQLRQMAKPFYNRLAALSETTQAETMAEVVGANVATSDTWPQPPPGPTDPAYDPAAFAAWAQQAAIPVTLGQIKQVFNFDGSLLLFRSSYYSSGNSQAGTNMEATESGSAAVATQAANAKSSESPPIANSGGSAANDFAPVVSDNSELALVVLTPLE